MRHVFSEEEPVPHVQITWVHGRSADQKRKIVPGPEGVTILALGGTPGKAYEPPTRSKSAK